MPLRRREGVTGMNSSHRDCDMRVAKIANELGVTLDEVVEMRRQIEMGQIMAPQRFVVVGRMDLPRNTTELGPRGG